MREGVGWRSNRSRGEGVKGEGAVRGAGGKVGVEGADRAERVRGAEVDERVERGGGV